MTKIDLSIIVPIYNVENYLEECLESLLKIKNINYEVILVDDGSKDGSYKIAKKYLEKNKEIIKLIQKVNGGQSSARNVGIKIAEGEYISFVDSDDFINATEFEKIVFKIKKNNLELGIGNLYKIEPNQVILYRRKIAENKIYSGVEFVEECIKNNCHRTESWINIYKREFLLKNNLFFKEGVIYEDALFIMKAFYYTKKVMYFNIDFYNYRYNPESTINKKVTCKNYYSAYKILNELINFYESKNIKNKYWRIFLLRRYFDYLKKWEIKNYHLYKEIINFEALTLKDFAKKVYIILFSFRAVEIQFEEKA